MTESIRTRCFDLEQEFRTKVASLAEEDLMIFTDDNDSIAEIVFMGSTLDQNQMEAFGDAYPFIGKYIARV